MSEPTDEFASAKALFLEGLAEAQNKRWEVAEIAFRGSLKLLPGRETTISNLLAALIMQEKYQEAWEIAEDAAVLGGQNSVTNTNLGILYHKAREFEKALSFLDRAIDLDAGNAEAHLNRGKVLIDLNRVRMAIGSFDQALEVRPDFAEAEFCKSLALLVSGDFEKGWQLYESRWFVTNPKLAFSQPLWLGREELAGKTILLHWEQGFGDTIQFSRFAKEVKKLGCNVVLKVQPALVDLLKSLEGVDELITTGSSVPAFDYYCPLMSLPLALAMEPDSLPNVSPYLCAKPEKITKWSRRLGPKSRLRVGIVWSGSTTHAGDYYRSIALHEFLMGMPDQCDLISLQKDVRKTDASALTTTGNIVHFGDELKDFSDTAALCTLVDEVVTVDTSVAHLAGALGCNVNLLVPFKPDFRWLLDRNDSPWYPTMTLSRQDENRCWANALYGIKSKLAALKTL